MDSQQVLNLGRSLSAGVGAARALLAERRTGGVATVLGGFERELALAYERAGVRVTFERVLVAPALVDVPAEPLGQPSEAELTHRPGPSEGEA